MPRFLAELAFKRESNFNIMTFRIKVKLQINNNITNLHTDFILTSILFIFKIRLYFTASIMTLVYVKR